MNPRRDWERFWFDRIGGAPLGLFRILFGLGSAAYAALLFPDRDIWFTNQGPITYAVSRLINSAGAAGQRPINIIGPAESQFEITLFFAVFILFALTLSAGFLTRLSSIVVWVAINSLHNRNPAILNGGDLVYSVMAFYLILSPSGAALSVDRIIRVARGVEKVGPVLIVPWTQRLMQLQVSIIYLSTVLGKASGPAWQDGSAIYYPLSYPELQRFPMPHFGTEDLWIIDLLTYGTLVIEASMAVFVWHPRLRLYALLGGVMLHLGIEYSMNIPLFAGIMISTYAVFLNDEDWRKLRKWLRRRCAKSQLDVSAKEEFRPSALAVLRMLDPIGLVDYREHQRDSEEWISASDRAGHRYTGLRALQEICSRLPLLKPAKPLLNLARNSHWIARLEAVIVSADATMPEAHAPSEAVSPSLNV